MGIAFLSQTQNSLMRDSLVTQLALGNPIFAFKGWKYRQASTLTCHICGFMGILTQVLMGAKH